ncbi:translocation associated membrane protein [Echinococcus multilocularis]|uniref:Translocation associated membrane protein n=1 Tax=Echinococcus multilocularis TaxID=6211 RepID=A0A068YCH4_ECHMU|nr:translocation associated membrane protein [Echinococcus multilocularis]
MPVPKKKSRNTSYFSHDFIIANHGDIVSVIAMIFIGGMLFPGPSRAASLFVAMQHNASNERVDSMSDVLYTTGRYDLLAVFFYTLICIIVHAVIQEYILDKMSKKLHLPRFMQSKFNESGQLLFFYVFSVYWAVYALINERFLTSLDGLWSGYPHAVMPFWIKVFFIVQISYWVHNFPELYFQKVKKSEMTNRVFYSSLFLIGVSAGYFMNFSKLAMILVILHYVTDSFFHFSRLMKLYGHVAAVNFGFAVYNGLYIVSRIMCSVLAFLTFYIPTMNIVSGNFNTWIIRLNCMMFVLLTQAHMVWTFINYHFTKMRERKAQQHPNSVYITNNDLQKRKEKQQRKAKQEDSRESLEYSNNGVKQRKQKAQ